jgi:hypothetical protein
VKFRDEKHERGLSIIIDLKRARILMHLLPNFLRPLASDVVWYDDINSLDAQHNVLNQNIAKVLHKYVKYFYDTCPSNIVKVFKIILNNSGFNYENIIRSFYTSYFYHTFCHVFIKNIVTVTQYFWNTFPVLTLNYCDTFILLSLYFILKHGKIMKEVYIMYLKYLLEK